MCDASVIISELVLRKVKKRAVQMWISCGQPHVWRVFVTVRIEDLRIRADLEYLKVGKGYYYTLFRPYHLWFLEEPISVARACLYKQTTLVPQDVPVADSMTISKRDLLAGEKLNEFGGFTFHGVMECAKTAGELNALPVGLAPGAVMERAVRAGEIIRWQDVRLDEQQTVVRLRRIQQDQFS